MEPDTVDLSINIPWMKNGNSLLVSTPAGAVLTFDTTKSEVYLESLFQKTALWQTFFTSLLQFVEESNDKPTIL
jgi:hypothetical protein